MLIKILEKVSDLKPLQSLLGLEKKKFIVKLIDDMRGIVPVVDALRLIKIAPDKYYRWRAEVYGQIDQISFLGRSLRGLA